LSPELPLWSVEQVCTFLNVGKTTVYELVKKGDLKALKIGRATRFSPAAVVEWAGGQ
jgi:excisionase family DNA binding protein